MKITRKASAHWAGSGKDGSGTVSTQSGILQDTPQSYKSRFESGSGTNPEELVGAAHAGCFSMKLAFNFQEAGITPDSIDTNATVILEDGMISKIELETEVKAPGLSEDQLQKLANAAKEECPISKTLKSEISLSAKLIS